MKKVTACGQRALVGVSCTPRSAQDTRRWNHAGNGNRHWYLHHGSHYRLRGVTIILFHCCSFVLLLGLAEQGGSNCVKFL